MGQRDKEKERENKIRERRHSKAHFVESNEIPGCCLDHAIHSQPQQTRNEVAMGKTHVGTGQDCAG